MTNFFACISNNSTDLRLAKEKKKFLLGENWLASIKFPLKNNIQLMIEVFPLSNSL